MGEFEDDMARLKALADKYVQKDMVRLQAIAAKYGFIVKLPADPMRCSCGTALPVLNRPWSKYGNLCKRCKTNAAAAAYASKNRAAKRDRDNKRNAKRRAAKLSGQR